MTVSRSDANVRSRIIEILAFGELVVGHLHRVNLARAGGEVWVTVEMEARKMVGTPVWDSLSRRMRR
jgi:hypothetical protein